MIARWQAFPLWLPLLLTMGALLASAQEPPRPLTTAAAVRGLAPAVAAGELPVRLRGTLLLVT
ncbi:MAG: hypothetical protein HZC55_15185, partial [Verrucomicrobia bacterium]|nr:hypothetical protein [Verrucomicrobiota bacterium]